MGDVCSFKSFLANELAEFADLFGIREFTPSLFSEFAILQATYREEGELVFPRFFITDDLTQFLSVTGSQDDIPIGSANYSDASIQRVFKECAVLASHEPWSIYVYVNQKGFHYGVFRTDRDPLNPTAFEKLRTTLNHNFRVCGLSRIGQNFLEIRSNQGQFRYVNTGSDQDRSLVPHESIARFASVVTRDIKAELKPAIAVFYSRLIFDILHAPSGAIVVIVNADREWPKLLSDGIRLVKPIHICEEVQSLIENPNANDSHRSIESKSALIQDMSRMDGLIVIDTRGTVLGYRYFIKQLDRSSNTGGARKRAFEAVSAHIGDVIVAGLYKSTDGAISMVERSDS